MTFSRQHKRHIVRSVLRYPGCKAFLIDTVRRVVKENTFIEAYAGSAILSLNLASSHRIVLNDIDPAVSALWLNIRDNHEAPCNRVRNVPITVSEWEKQREIYAKHQSDIDSAFAFLFLNRTNFSGMVVASPIGGMKQDGKYKIDFRFSRSSIIKWINRAHMLLWHNSEIMNEDAVSLSDMDGFLYLDPPYLDIDGRLYRHNYTIDDMKRLLYAIMDRKKPWMFSYSPSDMIDDILDGFYRMEVDHRYGIKTPSEKGSIEHIWSNVPLPEQTKLEVFP